SVFIQDYNSRSVYSGSNQTDKSAFNELAELSSMVRANCACNSLAYRFVLRTKTKKNTALKAAFVAFLSCFDFRQTLTTIKNGIKTPFFCFFFAS
ncbi:MAG: hypothetical protein LBJ57_04925, partial [Prevotellaceae bacterium]|nr:hypothetical protein [Prevotellaceae bacterium]